MTSPVLCPEDKTVNKTKSLLSRKSPDSAGDGQISLQFSDGNKCYN